jgi:hypothetical protein
VNESFLKEIGRSYIVSSFLPSAVFVTIGLLLFRGFLPAKWVTQFAANSIYHASGWILGLLLILWVAFFLFSSNDFTVKLFEGYFIPKAISNWIVENILAERHLKGAKNYFDYAERKTRIEDIKNSGKRVKKEEERQLSFLWTDAFRELQDLEVRSPIEVENLLPTRLGNVLRSSEIYAAERYWIEELNIWPRLFSILPQAFLKNLEEKNNQFMFLLNSAFLAFVNAAICFLFCAGGLPCRFLPNLAPCFWVRQHSGFFSIGYDYISPLGFLFIGITLVAFGYMLYWVAVNSAEDFGMLIRAGFDLYRNDLLKQLNWKLPKNIDDERDTWIQISRFFIAESRMQIGPIKLPNYQYDNNKPAGRRKKAVQKEKDEASNKV